MEKKDIIFALKLFIAGVLLGIFAGFLGVNPLGITQAQVVIVLYSIFLGLGLITVILTFYFIRKSYQAYQSYQREEEDEEIESQLCIFAPTRPPFKEFSLPLLHDSKPTFGAAFATP